MDEIDSAWLANQRARERERKFWSNASIIGVLTLIVAVGLGIQFRQTKPVTVTALEAIAPKVKLTDAQYKAILKAAEAERKQQDYNDHLARKAALDVEPYPDAAELVTQTSSDNYGIEPYFILTDSSAQDIAATGKARLRLTIKNYSDDTEEQVWDFTTTASAQEYGVGTRGLGAFKRDAVFFKFDKISTENISGKSGFVYLTFTSHRGIVIKAKTYVSYP